MVDGTTLSVKRDSKLFPRDTRPHPGHCCGSGCRPPLGPAHEVRGQKGCGRPGLSADGPPEGAPKHQGPSVHPQTPRESGIGEDRPFRARGMAPGPRPAPPLRLHRHLCRSSGSRPPPGLGSPGSGHSCALRPGQVAGFLGRARGQHTRPCTEQGDPGWGTGRGGRATSLTPPPGPSCRPDRVSTPVLLPSLGWETMGAARG